MRVERKICIYLLVYAYNDTATNIADPGEMLHNTFCCISSGSQILDNLNSWTLSISQSSQYVTCLYASHPHAVNAQARDPSLQS